MRVSIIGGSGFVGTSLVRRLFELQRDFSIGDLQTSQAFPDRGGVLDIRIKEDLRTELIGDIVVNLAAVHRDDITDPDEYHSTNVEGARVLCEVCEEKSINKIVFTSSVAVYGFAPPGTG